MEKRCEQCILNGTDTIICRVISLGNAFEELYGCIPVLRNLYKLRECPLFEAKEDYEEKICEDSRS